MASATPHLTLVSISASQKSPCTTAGPTTTTCAERGYLFHQSSNMRVLFHHSSTRFRQTFSVKLLPIIKKLLLRCIVVNVAIFKNLSQNILSRNKSSLRQFHTTKTRKHVRKQGKSVLKQNDVIRMNYVSENAVWMTDSVC